MADIQIHRSREEAAGLPSTGCACGEHDDAVPEIDVQTIPHAVRHSALFGVLDGLAPGFAVVLSATHDPVPLLQQLEQRAPGGFEVAYLDRGPERWRLHVRRAQTEA